jgi:two-component system NtrC family sensor kinase
MSYCDLMCGGRTASCSCPLTTQPSHAEGTTYEATSTLAPGRLYEVTIRPVRDAAGGVRALVQVARDVTERQRLQAELLQAQKLSAVGELVAGIAHELNNPLAGITACTHLLLREVLPDELRHDVEAINREADRAARVVRGLLTFARRHDTRRESVDLQHVLAEVFELRMSQLNLDDVEVVQEVEREPQRMTGDPFQLEQVFLNLVNNAHQAMLEHRRPGA